MHTLRIATKSCLELTVGVYLRKRLNICWDLNDAKVAMTNIMLCSGYIITRPISSLDLTSILLALPITLRFPNFKMQSATHFISSTHSVMYHLQSNSCQVLVLPFNTNNFLSIFGNPFLLYLQDEANISHCLNSFPHCSKSFVSRILSFGRQRVQKNIQQWRDQHHLLSKFPDKTFRRGEREVTKSKFLCL